MDEPVVWETIHYQGFKKVSGSGKTIPALFPRISHISHRKSGIRESMKRRAIKRRTTP
jgi:hypothetical protein